jgi:hypothetical protein
VPQPKLQPIKLNFVAKEDFCYTHYDGDEARDMAHMNRLERGAYTDIRVFQRKIGHLSLDQIKKVLSKDFDECWPAIELVLKQDEEGKYYIEWLENSMHRAKKHSLKQSGNGKNGGRPSKNKPNGNPDETQIKPKHNPTESQKKPLGDGDEYGYEEESKEGGVGETLDSVIDDQFVITPNLPLPKPTLEAAERNQFSLKGSKNTEFLKKQWGVFVAERIHDPPERCRQFRQLSDLTSYFINWVRNKHPSHVKQRNKQVGETFEPD